MSLRLKLLLWYTGVFAISGAVLVAVLYALIAHKMDTEADKFLEDEYEEWVRLTLEFLDQPELLEETMRRETRKGRHYPLTYRLRDTSAGRDILFLMDPDRRADLAAAAPILSAPLEKTYSFVRIGKARRPYRLFTAALDPERHPHLVIQVGMYARLLDKRVASLRKYLVIVLVFVVLVAALGGGFLAARSLRPIDRLVAELSQIESQNLADRLEVGAAGDEVDRLREGINRMLERLNRAFGRLESFTADAAHELRTPLAALQCRLEVALDRPRGDDDTRDALADALEQVAGLNAMVDNLLLLARMDAGPETASAEPVALDALVGDVCELFGLLAEEKGVALDVECPGGLVVEGDRMLLRRLLGNLLDNAVAYTPEGGRVTVQVRPEDAGCLLAVADTGMGIDPEALAHVFDRFYRADPSRSRAEGGVGLGLSIVKRIVELHHGTIDVESRPGEGTSVLVRLPRRLPATPGDAPGHDEPPEP